MLLTQMDFTEIIIQQLATQHSSRGNKKTKRTKTKQMENEHTKNLHTVITKANKNCTKVIHVNKSIQNDAEVRSFFSQNVSNST